MSDYGSTWSYIEKLENRIKELEQKIHDEVDDMNSAEKHDVNMIMNRIEKLEKRQKIHLEEEYELLKDNFNGLCYEEDKDGDLVSRFLAINKEMVELKRDVSLCVVSESVISYKQAVEDFKTQKKELSELKDKINYIDSIKTPFELFIREVKDNKTIREVLREFLNAFDKCKGSHYAEKLSGEKSVSEKNDFVLSMNAMIDDDQTAPSKPESLLYNSKIKCHYCNKIETKDNLFIIDEDTNLLFHNPCYHKWKSTPEKEDDHE